MSSFIWYPRFELHGLEPAGPQAHMVAGWLNDNRVTSLLFAGLYPAEHDAIREEWRHSLQNPNEIVFMVYAGSAHDEFIGTTGLYSINWVARTAEYRIFLGNKEFWGQGLGTGVTKCVLRYAFEKLNLHSIWVGVNVENKGSVRMCEKAGFVHEGTLRQIYYRNGRYYDVYRLSQLKEEWCGNAQGLDEEVLARGFREGVGDEL